MKWNWFGKMKMDANSQFKNQQVQTVAHTERRINNAKNTTKQKRDAKPNTNRQHGKSHGNHGI